MSRVSGEPKFVVGDLLKFIAKLGWMINYKVDMSGQERRMF